MKKQNYVNAILILTLSAGSLFVGYLVADLERKDDQKSFLKFIESQRRSQEIDTKVNIDLLVLIKKGNFEKAEEILTMSVKSSLKHASQTNNKLREKALEYQESFCSDKCLGI